MPKLKTVAVVLSGCGVYDGSEIHEAVSILIALDQFGAKAVCLAPDMPQHHVVDHLAGKPAEGQTRNVLQEAARIARGKIKPLAGASANEFDAIVFPGGFGAAKNLSDFAFKGPACTVHPEVARFIREAHAAGKPIGLACIAPVLAARVLGAAGVGPKVTLGADPDNAAKIEAMNARHANTEPTGICVDEANRLVSTPCYMNEVSPWIVYQGAQKMVEQLLRLTGTR